MNMATQAQAFLNGLMTDKTTAKWLEKLVTSYLPLAVMVLLILMLASNAAQLTWRLIPAGQESQSGLAKTPRPVAPSGKREMDTKGLDQVAELHLFGLAGEVKTVPQIEAKAPETRLNLTLHGVFVEADPAQGTAIIGTSGSTQKYYKVGATIMNGVKLQGVFDDRVVLLRNGQSEVLRFPKISSGSLGPVAALPTSAVATENNTTVNTESLSEYREIFQNEPLKVFEHVRFVPVRSREGLKGYRVLPQKNRELYNKLGIRPSDLVTGVNGVNLTNDQEAMKLMGMLKEATTIQVDIVRNGQPQSLTFNLN